MPRLSRIVCALLLALTAAWGGAQRLGDVSFTTPPGWTVQVEGGLATFTPDGGAAQGVMVLLPPQTVSGDARKWFAARVAQLSNDGEVLERSEVSSTQTASGTPLLVQAVSVRVARGTQQRFYTAVLSGGKATLAVLAVPGGDALKRFQPGLIALVNSVASPGQAASGAAAARPPAGGKAPLPAVKPQNAAQFGAAGGDPESQVIPDEFRCYQVKEGSGLTPELVVQILPGGKYRTSSGAGSFGVSKDGSLRKTTWRGGPLNGASGYLNFGDHGQSFSLSDVGETAQTSGLRFECYQRGPMENLRLLQFRLKTPAPAPYPCVLSDGSGKSGGTLEILPGGAYRLGGQAGRVAVDFRSDQDEDWSDLEFTGGPLEGAIGSYSEDESGVREVSVFRPKMSCRSVTKPTPIPRYGTAKAPAPPRGSGGLTGAYAAWSPDTLAIMGYGGCGGTLCWSTRFFTKEGYVYTGEPEAGLDEADCSRTHPNGLPICEVYRVQAGKITFGGDKPETFRKEGRNLQIGGQTYEPMLPLQGVGLGGAYESKSFVGGGTSTTSGSFQRDLVFTPQGRFSLNRSGGVVSTATDTGTSLGNVIGGVAVTSKGGSGGTYRVTGYTLELTYAGGHVERKFAFALPDKSGKPDLGLLRIAGSTYTRQDGK
ncbi:hypothetical protein [Deinococcus aestuarii]|uniref:hypothetical protein n=1 Tax=Deinococcus aestuarii TaxID=2774531 RepID=UPI001C0D791A|nr:hypothetical protein [Deinococcus aestuarii]